jgi:hypothetical protein
MPKFVMRVCMCSALAGCCAAIAGVMIAATSELLLLFLIPILIGVAGSVSMAILLLIQRPVSLLLLENSLQTRPGKRTYPVSDVLEIKLIHDAAEDYDDVHDKPSPRGVRMVLRSRGRIRRIDLMLDSRDVTLLKEWAASHDVRMTDH